MAFDFVDVGGIRVFRPVVERLDAAVSARFKSQILDTYSSGIAVIVVDMSKVSELDITGVAAILSASRAAGTTKVFVLSDVSGSVKKFLELTKMSNAFTMFRTSGDAVNALSELQLRAAA